MKGKGEQFVHTSEPERSVYHGSAHGFAPGESIDPTPDVHHGGEDRAFGTVFPEVAGHYGTQHAASQGRLFSSVYEVEHKGTPERHPSDVDHQSENNMPTDRTGFRVKRHHSFVFPDPKGGWWNETHQETPRGTG